MVSDWQAEFRERLSSTHNLLGLTTAHRERNRRSHLAHPFSWAYRVRRGLPLPSGPLLAVAFPILPSPVLHALCTRLPPSSYRRRRHTTFPSCHLLAVAYKRRPSPHQHLTPSTSRALCARAVVPSLYTLSPPLAPPPPSPRRRMRGVTLPSLPVPSQLRILPPLLLCTRDNPWRVLPFRCRCLPSPPLCRLLAPPVPSPPLPARQGEILSSSPSCVRHGPPTHHATKPTAMMLPEPHPQDDSDSDDTASLWTQLPAQCRNAF